MISENDNVTTYKEGSLDSYKQNTKINETKTYVYIYIDVQSFYLILPILLGVVYSSPFVERI